MKILLALLACATPVAALAADEVTLTSEVLVERVKQDADGKQVTVLEPPAVVVPGEKLVFVLNYRNQGDAPAADFVVTNPIPSSVAYAGSEGEAGLVSIDGGKSWDALANLKVTQADGSVRAATPEDVTHVRWTFKRPIPAGESGKLSFRGTVR